jgi:hypothetical protein
MILVKFLVPPLELPQVLVGLQQLRMSLVCWVTLSLKPQLEELWCHCWPPAVPHYKVSQTARQMADPALLEMELSALNGSFHCQDCVIQKGNETSEQRTIC